MKTKIIYKIEFEPLDSKDEYLDSLAECSKLMEKGIQMSSADTLKVVENMVSVLNYMKKFENHTKSDIVE